MTKGERIADEFRSSVPVKPRPTPHYASFVIQWKSKGGFENDKG